MTRLQMASVLLSSVALFTMIKPPPFILLICLQYFSFYDLYHLHTFTTTESIFTKKLFHILLAIYVVYSNLIIYSFYRQELFRHSLNIVGVISLSDALQYFFGKWYGKTPITSISPSKTLEGYIYGFVGTFVVSYVIFQLQTVFIVQMILSGIIGDLFVSFIKRQLNVKDTSDLLKAHGGWIDRLDGIYMGFVTSFYFY